MSESKNLFGFPDVGRTGLGHSLLAWGRCAVWCRDTGATMLAPRWLRLRVGPYLRRERDKRNYFLQFHKGPYLGEPSRTSLLLTASRLYAELDLPATGFKSRRPTVVIFRNAMANNERKMFHYIAAEGPYLYEQFVKMVRPRHIPPVAKAPFIAAHVRMGDFGASTIEQLKAGATNARIPVEWYAAIAKRLREQLGRDMPIIVFSDGPDGALSPLLSLSNTSRSPKQQSVTDMLAIAQAQVLIASGSGFSHWGSFLGSVPRVSFPGQSLSRHVKLADPDIEAEGDTDLPAGFITAVQNKSLNVST